MHDSMSNEVLILRIGPINEVLTSERNPGCNSIKLFSSFSVIGAVISRFDDKWVRTLTLKILLTCLDSKYVLIVKAILRRLGS